MKRSFAALVAVALATSAAAVTPYSQLRHDYPQIDEAVAAATESDLHGTFNRLSALYNRSAIQSLGADAGTNGQLPENFLRNLEATLIDLQEDLGKDQVGALTVQQKLNLLQVVDIYAVARPLELFQSEVITTCLAACPIGQEIGCGPGCIDDDPAVINEVQDVVSAARTLYKNVADTVTGETVSSGNLNANNFGPAIDNLVSLVTGVESIDVE